MGFKMNGSPAKLGTISGTAGHSSALKMKAASALKQETDYVKMQAEAAKKDPRYAKLTAEEYEAEAKRQSEHYKKTGNWDAMGVYDHKGEKKVVKTEITPNNEDGTAGPDVDEPKKERTKLQKLGDKLKEGLKRRKASDADYKKNRKAGESKYQYNIRMKKKKK